MSGRMTRGQAESLARDVLGRVLMYRHGFTVRDVCGSLGYGTETFLPNPRRVRRVLVSMVRRGLLRRTPAVWASRLRQATPELYTWRGWWSCG